MKTAYICHPVTTGQFKREDNLSRINEIRKEYARGGDFVPVVPTDIMREVYPFDGSQNVAYERAFNIMEACDEVHVFRGWEHSKGCVEEVQVAVNLGKTVKWRD